MFEFMPFSQLEQNSQDIKMVHLFDFKDVNLHSMHEGTWPSVKC